MQKYMMYAPETRHVYNTRVQFHALLLLYYLYKFTPLTYYNAILYHQLLL